MKKFTLIFLALVMCVAALAIGVAAANPYATDCPEHDWSAWKTAGKDANGDYIKARSCACGAVEERIEHKFTEVKAKAPTCTSDGNTAYRVCECGYMETMSGMATNIKNVTLLATEHDLETVAAKAATCAEDGNIEYKKCKNCDWMETANGMATNAKAVILVVDHELVKVEAKAPTATENGNIAYSYCKNCDYMCTPEGMNTNQKAVILPATGEPTNPDTGDSGNAIFFVVALVAVVALGAAAVSFKKREN